MSPFGRRGHGHGRHSLQRRIFLWFAATTLATAVVVGAVAAALSSREWGAWHKEVARVHTFAAAALARAWDDPAERTALVESIARDLEVGVRLVDARGGVVEARGPTCGDGTYGDDGWGKGGAFAVDVPGKGRAELCFARARRPGPGRAPFAFFAAVVVVWAASGLIARRLARPLKHLAKVARDLGDGQLQARAQVKAREPAEVHVLAEALNDMAARIEQHVNDQRTLLAGVSHELRTPLGHVRLLVELAREGATPDASRRLDEIEREVVEMDDLVGQLLASARLDFSLDEPRALDAVDVARRAIERAGLPPSTLHAPEPIEIRGDPTLLSRALANLIENARAHAGGAVKVRVEREKAGTAFLVEDDGPGLPKDVDLFAPFVRKGEKGTLGLGLYLVRRIALAHGGTAIAEDKPGGGARVGFRVP